MKGKSCLPRQCWLRRSLLLVLFLMGAGCAAKGTVSGKVTYQGKPLPGGMVTFVTEQGGHAVSSDIGSDGSYTIEKIPPGPVKIGVRSNDSPDAPKSFGANPPPGKGIKMGPPEGAQLPEGVGKGVFDPFGKSGPKVKIPPQYNDPATSTLTYTVTSGSQTHEIELK
jgi:hypothetical protein